MRLDLGPGTKQISWTQHARVCMNVNALTLIVLPIMGARVRSERQMLLQANGSAISLNDVSVRGKYLIRRPQSQMLGNIKSTRLLFQAFHRIGPADLT